MASVDPELKAEVQQILEEHRGKDNAIVSADLIDAIEIDDAEGNPRIREIIRELITEDQIPIASYNRGYFIIETEDELNEYLEHLDARIRGHVMRRVLVQRAAEDWDEPIEESDDLDLL